MPKISVIIPVYNTGKYLSECLDSVIAQTMHDIEIICVNDGSTDNSAEILAQYAKLDSRVKILNQENSGVVIARNNGIAHSTADLIYPLDSDDIINPDCLEKLYDKITSSNYRVVMSNAKTFGKINGFFKQPKLNKIQMYGYHECCIISALFYKSDFLKFGGYCKDFNGYGGDDMDYWLNYIDNNLPMIRLDDVLFLYRTKEDNESVWKDYNPQERIRRYEYKEQKLLERHPKMRKWVRLYKFANGRICRFFFRMQDGYIKIFKIPVYRIRKGNTVFGYYFNARDNFGDLLNPFLFEYFGYQLLHTNINKCDVIAIGSLMELLFLDKKCKKIKRPVIVYGTGFIQDPDKKIYLKRKLDVRAVRGYNTLSRLQGIRGVKISKDVVVADPGLLSSILLDGKIPSKKYKLGIIPHYVDVDSPLLKKITCKDTTVIDITLDPVSFMKKIAECENVISSAMHGLIAADSLGIPNIRMIISDKIIGGDYKYDDYYSAFGIKKHHRVDLRKEYFAEKDLEELKNTYQVKKESVHKKQDELIRAFPYRIKRKICL